MKFIIHFTGKIIFRYLKCLQNIRKLKSTGFKKNLNYLNINTIKNSDTLFILGSGASVNRFTKDQWLFIKENDSVGLNYWPIHDFVPTYLMFEMPRGERAKNFYDVLNSKTDSYKKIPLLYKGLYKNTEDFVDINKAVTLFNSALLDNIYLCNEFSIPGRNEEEFVRAIELLKKTGFFTTFNQSKVLAQYRATVTCALVFGIKSGYKNIVFCGVDLDDTKYFYEEDKEYYESKGINVPESGQVGTTHKTNVKTEISIPVSLALHHINDIVCKPSNINVFTTNEKSALRAYLDIYNWK